MPPLYMTSQVNVSGHRELKAIILAAGRNASTPNGRPLMLESLGDRTILECAVQNAWNWSGLRISTWWWAAAMPRFASDSEELIGTFARNRRWVRVTRYCRPLRF